MPPKPPEVISTKSELLKKVYNYAEDYNVSASTMISIINCENRDWDVDLQSGLHYKEGNRWGFPAGTQEKSYGLVQIHLPDNKQVSYEQAIDPDYSLNFMAKNIAAGRATMWSCYKKIP